MDKVKRIIWIDAVKGVAILFLLLSHSIPNCDLFRNWISSWHIPIFFIICGYISSIKYKKSLCINQLSTHIKRRCHNLWAPYFFFGCFLILFYNLLNLYSGAPLDFYLRFKKLILMYGVDSLWFIPVYFFAEFMFLLVAYRKYVFIGFVILVLLLLGVNQEVLDSPFDLLYKIGIGCFFVFVGFFFSLNHLEQKIPLYLSIIILLCCVICSFFNWNSSMNAMRSAPIYLIVASLTSLSIISLMSKLEGNMGLRSRWLLYYGMNSLIIMCTNNLIIESLRLLDFKLTGNWMLNSGYLGYFSFFLLLTLLEYPMLKLFEGRFR